jgi:lysophospholipase L1-like esterase
MVLGLGQPGAMAPAAAHRSGPVVAVSEVLGVHAQADSAALAGKVYVALGDSISAGKYATTQDAIFPSIVADKLQMNLHPVARSGAKAAWALPQLVAIASAHPALVTIELGTNDAGFSTPRAAFTSQYEAIVNAVAGPNTRVVCIGSWLPSPGYDVIIADACVRHGGTFVSLNGFYGVTTFHAPEGGSSYLGRTDWFHPGDQGHEAIAAAVLAALGAGPAPVLTTAAPAPRLPDVIRTHPQ